MRNPRRSSRKRIEGKSLIEILMVITIIGILASFLLSVIAVGIKRAKGVGAPQDPNDPDSPLLGPSSVPADHNCDEWPKEFGALAATGF